MSQGHQLAIEDVRDAYARISGVVHRTPVLTSRTINQLTGAQVYLKAENFQRVGAFKFRGAYNAICQLSPEQLRAGVLTYSSGNHAQAVALAARIVGTTAVILMPEDAPTTKLEATKGYGAEVVLYDRYGGDRIDQGRQLAAQRGLTLIPPYDDRNVIAGQATVALELLEEIGPLDMLVVPVGGGGLMAGCATAAKALYADVRMIGVEPENADDTKQSLAAGRRITIPVPRTMADGLALDTPGELTFAINRRLVDDIVLVSDDDIRRAMAMAFERLKVVIEPSGAASLAALLSARIDPIPPRVGVVLSGGNIGLQRFGELEIR